MTSRRGRGEGSIGERANGAWMGRVDLGYDAAGKRRRKCVYGKTRDEVAKRMKKLLYDQQQGLPIQTERQSVAVFLDKWLKETVRPSVRPATYTGYEVCVRRYITPALGRIPLAKLTPQEVQAFLNALLKPGLSKQGLSSRTAQLTHAVLRRALGQALKWDMVGRNVAKLVDPPRSVKYKGTSWTPAQARAFLDVMKGDRLEALYSVAVSVGLRRGEALGLRWDAVDLDKGTLTVRAALQRVDGKLQLLETKTASSIRTIPLPGFATKLLRAHRIAQLQERMRMGDGWTDSGYVFTTTVGTPIEPRNVNRSFTKALERCANRAPVIRFHDLRHTCASLLLAQGVPPRVVMEILGHSKISVTMDIYAHVMPAATSDAMDRMEATLFGG